MRVRRAIATDYAAMLDIWLDASRAGHPFLAEQVLQEQSRIVRDTYFPQAENWVIEHGGIKGFIGLIGNHIGGLFVAPAAHGQGFGRSLVEHASGRLGSLTVEVYEQNEGAIAFYRRCGFAPVGRKERDDEGRPLPLLRLERGSQAR